MSPWVFNVHIDAVMKDENGDEENRRENGDIGV